MDAKAEAPVFGHLMLRQTQWIRLMMEKIEGRRRRGRESLRAIYNLLVTKCLQSQNKVKSQIWNLQLSEEM